MIDAARAVATFFREVRQGTGIHSKRNHRDNTRSTARLYALAMKNGDVYNPSTGVWLEKDGTPEDFKEEFKDL
jgi:hypothetical protein